MAGELAGAPEPLPTDQIGACSDGTEPDPIDDDRPSAGREAEIVGGEESGWWASADRAVADAGLATREAGRALRRARQLVRTASAADAADEVAWQDSPSGHVSATTDAVEALAAAADEHRRWLADLLATTAGGGLRERPRIALADALSGALLALTDLPGLRRAGTCGRAACRADAAQCEHDLTGNPGLGPPGPTARYRPGVRLDRWVRTRDRRCRFPGCRRRVPLGGELDHARPWPDGDTSAGNLAGYCASHHRGKHQAPGWQYRPPARRDPARHHARRADRQHRPCPVLNLAEPVPVPVSCSADGGGRDRMARSLTIRPRPGRPERTPDAAKGSR